MSSAYRCFHCEARVAVGSGHRCADIKRDIADRIEVRSREVVAYFPGGADGSFLTVNEARYWAEALTKAADAADLLTPYTE